MMFSHWLKTLFFRRKYLFLFLLLASVFVIFLGISTFFLRFTLQRYCVNMVEKSLTNLIETRQPAFLVAENKASTEGLGGLSFIRLIREGNEIYFSENPQLDEKLQLLLSPGEAHSLVWVSLDERDAAGDWVIRTVTVQNSMIVQGGRRFPEILALYADMRLWMLCFMGIGVLTALMCSLVMKKSMGVMLSDITGWLKSGRTITDDDSILHDTEVYKLYSQIEDIVKQNRLLVQEMQESLDNVAHDLRTPMTRLRSVAEYSLQSDDITRLRDGLSDCLEESEYVLSMLNTMMRVAEAETGMMVLHKEVVSLVATLSDVVNTYEYVAMEKEISIDLDIDENIKIEVDRTRITQVWANIIDNGIKYGRRGGRIEVRAFVTETEVVVSFHDNGIGISVSEIDRIWERLFRGDRSRTEQGLGLGLNYVKAVVEAHGGRVAVTSILSEETTFSVTLTYNDLLQ